MEHWFAPWLAYFELTFTNPQLPEAGKCGQALDLADALSHEDQGMQAGEPVHVDDAGVPGEEHLQLLHRRLLPALYLVVVEAIVCTLKELKREIHVLTELKFKSCDFILSKLQNAGIY